MKKLKSRCRQESSRTQGTAAAPDRRLVPRAFNRSIPALAATAFLVAGVTLFRQAEARATGVEGLPSRQSSSSRPPNVALTAEEEAWLRDHPTIRVVQDPGWAPIEFADERGEPSGISEDYLRLIERRLRLRFERVRGLSWQEAYARLKRWELDMTTSMTATPEREEFLAFTKPYLQTPLVLLTRMDVPYIADMRVLAGKSVAVVDGYGSSEWMPIHYPEIPLVKVKNVLEGLALLRKGEVFAYSENMLVSGYYLTKLKLVDLKIAGETPYMNAQSLAVRRDWAILVGILQKALDSISGTEAAAIYQKWVPLRYNYGFDYRRLWLPLAAFALILAGLIAWIHQLSREIGKRKNAETALRQAHERLAKIFAAVPEGLVVSRVSDGTILDVNDGWPALSGYGREESIGKRSRDLNVFGDPADRERAFASLPGPQGLRDFEIRIRRKSGELRDAVLSADFLEVGGEPLMLSVIQDVTERRRAERERRESEEKLRLFIEHAPAALAMFDRNMRYIAVSRRWMSDYGLGERDIIGRSHYEVFPEVTEELKEIHRRGLAGEILRSEVDRFERTDGSVQYLRWEMRPWGDGAGGGGGIVIFSEDITDRMLAEHALRDSEARFRNLIELAPEAVFVQSEGRFLYLNAAMVGLFGASRPGDLLGSEIMARIAPEYREAVRGRIQAQRETRSPAPLMDQEYLRLDGTRVPVETTAVPIRFEDRDAHLVFVRDVTARKRTEEAVKASLREKETLLREIHHRVKNNMQVISSLLNLQAGHVEDADALRMLKEGQNRIRSMALIHEKLYQSPDLSTIDFASYLQSLARHLFLFFQIDPARIRLETELEDIRLDINSAMPCGLLVNELVSNALKHAFPGGRKGVVKIGLKRGPDGRLELRIADDGVGLPPGFDFRHSRSFGFQIVDLLVSQLEAEIAHDGRTGTALAVTFRELHYKKRI